MAWADMFFQSWSGIVRTIGQIDLGAARGIGHVGAHAGQCIERGFDRAGAVLTGHAVNGEGALHGDTPYCTS